MQRKRNPPYYLLLSSSVLSESSVHQTEHGAPTACAMRELLSWKIYYWDIHRVRMKSMHSPPQNDN